MEAIANVVECRVSQFGCHRRDRVLWNVAEGGAREISREGECEHGDGGSGVRHGHVLRGAGRLGIDHQGLLPCRVPVLGVFDGVSGMTWTTRRPRAATTRCTLDATADLWFLFCGGSVFSVGFAGVHCEAEEMRCGCPSPWLASYKFRWAISFEKRDRVMP